MATIKLPRLPYGYEKNPDLFKRYWDEAMTNIETAVNQVLLIPGIQEAIDNANAAAATANAAAESAQDTADAITSESAILASFPDNFVDPLINADSSGNVTIANHTRKYGDGTSVLVTGAVVATGLANPDVARIYYDDGARAGGAVSYQFTLDPAIAAQTGDRHSVGAVEIPSAGTQDGGQVFPPGYAIP